MPDNASDIRLIRILLVLTVATGVVDAVSFLGLGRVFTANMTGNVVLLGFAAAGTPGLSLLRSAAALAGFLLGASFGGRLAAALNTGSMPPGSTYRWLGTAIAIEAALMIAASIISVGYRPASMETAWQVYPIIVLTAVAMGIRNASIRKSKVTDLTTTVLTLTLTGLAADFFSDPTASQLWPRRVGAVVMMFAGALLGAVLLRDSMALALGFAALIATASGGYLLLSKVDPEKPD